jgi:hypothetical protein
MLSMDGDFNGMTKEASGSPSPQEIHEAAFVRAFVIPPKQGRFLELLPNRKRRKSVLRTLYHFRDLDPRFASQIPASDQSTAQIEGLLLSFGAPKECYLISDDRDLDAHTMALTTALEEARGTGGGTVLSCIPGQLGYYEGEEPGDRWLLRRGKR